MIELIVNNKDWIFSGIGVVILGGLVKLFFKKKSRAPHVSNIGKNQIKADNVTFSQTVINHSKIESNQDGLINRKVENPALYQLKNEYYGNQNIKRNYLFKILLVAYSKNAKLEIKDITDATEDELDWRPDETVDELKKLEDEGVIFLNLVPEELISPYTRIRLTPKFFETIK